MISVLILTKNEEYDIQGCLNSVSWCDDVHVFDSYSDDLTVQIAQQSGAKVTQRRFDGYSTQRNAALENLAFKYPWLFILDADERIPASLVPKLLESIKTAEHSVDGFRIRRRDYFRGTWLKHAQISPFYIRLIRIGKARYHREINEVLEVVGLVKDIDGYFDHFPFSKGLSHWINKHNHYSDMEAKQWFMEYTSQRRFSIKKALFSPDFSEKRFHQKGLFYKLPFRPFIKWFYVMFWRCGFLDGSAGFVYATLQSIYEYFIVLKSKEIRDMQGKKI